MKRLISSILLCAFVMSFIFGTMITEAKAEPVPLCYVYCDGIYQVTCCLEQVNPNCKGKNCKVEWVCFKSGWCPPSY